MNRGTAAWQQAYEYAEAVNPGLSPRRLRSLASQYLRLMASPPLTVRERLAALREAHLPRRVTFTRHGYRVTLAREGPRQWKDYVAGPPGSGGRSHAAGTLPFLAALESALAAVSAARAPKAPGAGTGPRRRPPSR